MATFPALPGIAFGLHKIPMTSTKIASHVSGREVRRQMWSAPLFQFELVYEGLDSAGFFTGLQAKSMQTLLNFYLSVNGQFGTFNFPDLVDPTVIYLCRFLDDTADFELLATGLWQNQSIKLQQVRA